MIRPLLPALLLCVASLFVGCGTTAPPSAEDPDELDSGSLDSGDVDSDNSASDDDGGDNGAPSIAPPGGRGADGAACSGDGDCAGGRCITADGWRGGYCSSQPCADATTDCNPGESASACFVRDVTELPWCGRGCRTTDDCRNGYSCEARGIGGASVCVPAGSGTGPIDPPPGSETPPTDAPPTDVAPPTEPPETVQPRVDGEPCSRDEDCAGGTCLQAPEWPDGYCTTVGCSSRADCATDDGEVDNRCLQGQGFESFCVRMCSGGGTCRSGYECRPASGGNAYCAPDPDGPVDPPPAGDAAIGDACASDADCGQYECATGFQYPDGYCTVNGCESDADCGSGAFCLNTFISRACIKRCNSDNDCRDGYNCGGVPGVQSPDGCIASFSGGGGGGIPGF